MLKYKKKISAAALAFVLSFGVAAPVSAEEPYEREAEIYQASSDIADAMTLILDTYVGEEVTADELYDAAMHGMMTALDDYSEYFSYEEATAYMDYFVPQSYGIGILYGYNFNGDLLISRVYEGSPAEKSGLKEGDVILRINGQTVTGSYDEDFEAYFALNQTGIALRIERDGAERDITTPFGSFVVPTVFVKTLPEKTGKTGYSDTIRYVEMTSVSEDTANELKKAIDQMKADGVTKVILDLRSNGGGILDIAVEICDMLVPKGTIMTTVDKDGTKVTYESNLEKAPFSNMIVLTDRYTASAAEVIAAALQDAKIATVIGEKTYGKGVVQSMHGMMDGSMIKLTTSEYFRRSGAQVNLKGVSPNISIPILEVPYEDIRVNVGGTSVEVPNVKQALNLLGYDMPAFNDVYDQRTADIVKKFQADNELLETGELNYTTLLAMNAALYAYYEQNDVIMDRALQEVNK